MKNKLEADHYEELRLLKQYGFGLKDGRYWLCGADGELETEEIVPWATYVEPYSQSQYKAVLLQVDSVCEKQAIFSSLEEALRWLADAANTTNNSTSEEG